MNRFAQVVVVVACGLTLLAAQDNGAAVPLSPAALDADGVDVSAAQHEGRAAVRLIESTNRRAGGLAIVRGSSLQDGEITLHVAGRRGPYSVPDDRGFVGLAFRVAADRSRYEYFYLRPDNGRAENQEQRNHATQYASHPDFPWPLLRKQFPSRYESYVDLVPGQWTAMRVVVRGQTARLFVDDSPQPALIVNDLKLPAAAGALALWIGPGTEAFFSALHVTRAE